MIFVGRDREVAQLKNRLLLNGLTVVVGRPLMGKTMLLKQSLGQLSETDILSGWAESTGEHADLLLRAISNLYTSWLANSSYREQAIVLWRTRKNTTIESIANFMRKALEVTSIASPALSRMMTGLLERLVETSASSRKSVVPRMSYESAGELLALVRDLSQKRIVLVLDSFERSPAPEEEQLGLTTFLRKRDWPGIHVVVLSRDTPKITRMLRQLAGESPSALMIELDSLKLSENDAELLLSQIRKTIPAAQGLGDEAIISLIDGYPGVIHWWLDRPDHSPLLTTDDLLQAASDAQGIKYRHIIDLIRPLTVGEKRMAARIALLPRLTEQTPNIAIDFIFPHDSIPEVERLQAAGVLDLSTILPSFGHPTRHEALTRLFQTDDELKPVLALEVRRAIEHFAEQTDPDSVTTGYVLVTLAYLEPTARGLKISPTHLFACKAALDCILLPLKPVDIGKLLAQIKGITYEKLYPLFAWIVTGLLDVVNLNPRRPYHTDLINTLEGLVRELQIPKMRLFLASSYANALNYDLLYDDYNARDQMLNKLRWLADNYPDEPQILEDLIRALAQSMAREFGDDISSPGLLFLAAVRGTKELRYLQGKAQPRETRPSEAFAEAINAEIRQRAVDLQRKAVRDFLLVTIYRWVRYSHSPDLDRELLLAKDIFRAKPDSMVVLSGFAKISYWCLYRDLFAGRLDRCSQWLGELRLAAEAQDHIGETDSWLFLGLIDTAEYAAAITGNPEESRPFLAEIDSLAQSREPFRAALARNRLGRVMRGLDTGEFDRLRSDWLMLEELLGSFPNDQEIRQMVIIGIGLIFRRYSESKEHQELLSSIAHSHEPLLGDALVFIKQQFNRHDEKRVRKVIRELLRRKPE